MARSTGSQARLTKYRSISRVLEDDHGRFQIKGCSGVLKDIMEGKTNIRFTFPINSAWNPDAILQEINNSDEDWPRLYSRSNLTKRFQTTSPLPTWAEIKLEEIIWSEDLLQRKMWIWKEGVAMCPPP